MARICSVSPEGVKRILRSVGPKFLPLETYPLHKYPRHPYPNPDSKRTIDLAERLDASIYNYYAAIESRGSKDIKARIEHEEAVVKAAGKLRDLLLKDDHLPTKQGNAQLIRDIEALLETNVSNIRGRKEWLEDPVFVGAAQWKDLKPKFLTRSPFEWLAGSYLPDDFWEFYGKKPTLQRGEDGKLIRGPFIRFVEQVLVEFEIANSGAPFSAEAIAKALTDARTDRFRTKPGGTAAT
jgi:hypothetical protein